MKDFGEGSGPRLPCPSRPCALRLSLALEVKLIKTPDRVRKVIDEINADTVAYSTRYRQITFVVYDLGHIRDETEFRRDLESAGTVIVIIVKH